MRIDHKDKDLKDITDKLKGLTSGKRLADPNEVLPGIKFIGLNPDGKYTYEKYTEKGNEHYLIDPEDWKQTKALYNHARELEKTPAYSMKRLSLSLARDGI